ncbi:NFX1-type zinc finger-containing protein 1-like isoform X2 [Agrilus planipennis]|uniref:NFX1-type zinc finger-containing protein 1-like isoform X2 n=1 Tax=Agrilus planipennis TaxID=224129 RepID=A0A1W4WJ17_AGRPL|nr:NFX1-type zinc finger-containing protein 1-like isoform X2 [Agrilus planipennis]
MQSRRGKRYSTNNSDRYLRQESPLLAYFNYLWEVPDKELCTVLQKNIEKSLQLLRNVLSPDEIINTVYLLLRISKLHVDFKTKVTTISVILAEVSRQLSVFIGYMPFIRNSEYQESLEKFWFAIYELIQELIKFNNPLHKEYVVKIYLNCKKFISKKNANTFNLPKIPESIVSDLKTYLEIDEIESINFYLLHSEIEKCNIDEATAFKSLKEFKSYEEYFKWQYIEIRAEFISTLSKAIKHLRENINSDNVNNEFQIMLNCTGVLNRYGLFSVTTGECKQKYFEHEEFIPGSLVCFSYNTYQTYTFGIVQKVFSEQNTLLINLINIDPHLLNKTFSMAVYKGNFYRAVDSILQSIKKNLFKELPFKEYILFGKNSFIEQPKYLQKASEYTIDSFKFKPCDFNTWPPKEYFQLNAEQYLALQHLVTNELALLTGYPGSGKTHVILKFINLLLQNKQIWHQHNSGPILLLAFTNQSLDNFMEKILPLTDSLVRIGTQTKSEKLKNSAKLNVSRVSLDIRKKINNIADEINKVAKEAQAIFKNGGLISIVYLGITTISNQDIYDKLMGNNETERIVLMNEILGLEEYPLTDVNSVCSPIYYVTVSDLQARHDRNSIYLQWRLAHKEAHKKFYPRNDVDFDNIQNLSGNKLWGLYFYLVDRYVNQLKEKLNIMEEQKRILRDSLTEEENIENSKELKQKMIVGLTFSGAAFRKSTIDALDSSIVIVEETSHIEHYHVLGTIPKSCKHLILIGDNRVSEINNYSLVDILSEYKYPFKSLKKQFRMKSEIAFLLKTLFYPEMVNDESVEKISSVPGIPKPIFFINHCLENDGEETINWNRVVNLYEIEYLVQLAKFLLSKNVSAESITILTITKYQALEFDKFKENDETLQKIKSWSIDKFQSLENDIILLSLFGINEYYRSFLTKETRLRVALSRSKQGFYLIGNMEKLCKQCEIWVPIKELLEEKGYIGNALPISCSSHVGKECGFIEKPEDFSNLKSHFLTCSLENLTINN